MVTEKVLYFCLWGKEKLISWPIAFPLFPPISKPCSTDGCTTVMLMEWSWTTIMTVRSDAVQGDTCLFPALQTSSLNSCYVWIKRTGSGSLAAPTRSVTLNCVPCQLQTHRAAEEVTGGTPFFLSPSLPLSPNLSFSPLFCLLYRTFHFNATYAMHNIQGEDRMMYGRHEPERRQHISECSDITWSLSCQITLTPCVKIPSTSPWSREADVLSLPSSSGQSCQDLLVKDTEDSADGKNELSEVELVSLSGMTRMMRNSTELLDFYVTGFIHLYKSHSWILSLEQCSSAKNRSASLFGNCFIVRHNHFYLRKLLIYVLTDKRTFQKRKNIIKYTFIFKIQDDIVYNLTEVLTARLKALFLNKVSVLFFMDLLFP